MARSKRNRLAVDAPESVIQSTKRTADRFYRGSLTEATMAALSTFQWLIRQRLAGRRVVSVSTDRLPEVFEEPILPELEEGMTQKWNWLVEREHPWRRQLWIKGRRITAGDLARTAEIEGWTPEQVAAEYELPVDAAEEAAQYLAEYRELVLAEEEENRLAAAAATRESPHEAAAAR